MNSTFQGKNLYSERGEVFKGAVSALERVWCQIGWVPGLPNLLECVPACERGVETGFFWPKSFHDSMILYSSIYVVLPHKYVSTNVRKENLFLCTFFLADKDHFISLLYAVLSKHFFRKSGWNFCPAHPYKSIVAVWFLKFCS